MYKYILGVFLLVSASVYGSSEYHVPVNLPSCDVNNPEVLIIDSASGFSQINNPDKRIFCVKKGTYLVNVDLSINGTPEAPRFILYFDPDETTETHPANMDEADRAVVQRLRFLGSSYWVVDRIAVKDPSQYSNVRMQPREPYNTHWAEDVHHIVLNRILVEESGRGSGQIAMGGNNLTVQDSVIRNSFNTLNEDDHGIVFYGHHNRLVGNEIYNNTGDDIQVSRIGNFEGAIIAYNEMYVTPERRTDGNGNTPVPLGLGTHLCQENAIGFKGGGASFDPVLMIGNKMWGFDREVDPNCATGGGGYFPLSFNFNSQYITIEDNIFYDNIWGMVFANPTSHNVIVRNNLFFNVEKAISAPSSTAHTNTYTDNKLYDVERFFVQDSVDSTNTVSNNTVLTEQVCFTKYQITNPTEICIGKSTTQPTQPVNTKAEEIVDAILNLKNLLNNYQIN